MQLTVLLISGLISIIYLICLILIYRKANEAWYCAVIPIYNVFVLLKIIHRPFWWFFLMLVPIFGLIWQIRTINLLAKVFGKDERFTVGLILLSYIFIPILAFGDSKYNSQFNERKKNEEELMLYYGYSIIIFSLVNIFSISMYTNEIPYVGLLLLLVGFVNVLMTTSIIKYIQLIHVLNSAVLILFGLYCLFFVEDYLVISFSLLAILLGIEQAFFKLNKRSIFYP